MNPNPLLLPKNASQLFINGPVGKLDTLVLKPKDQIRGMALICHPDPKGGGSNTNKIVQTMAKVLNSKGYIAYCPNLRGVGQSEGEHDFGRGEVSDGQAIYAYMHAQHGDLPLVLAGFSFGCSIAAQLGQMLNYQQLVMVGPAVTRYSVPLTNKQATLVIHGQADEVIELDAVLTWATSSGLPVSVFPATGHFFHGKIVELHDYLMRALQV